MLSQVSLLWDFGLGQKEKGGGKERKREEEREKERVRGVHREEEREKERVRGVHLEKQRGCSVGREYDAQRATQYWNRAELLTAYDDEYSCDADIFLSLILGDSSVFLQESFRSDSHHLQPVLDNDF